MINKVKTENGKTYKAREVAFYLKDKSGFEWYVGRVALIGDEYLYVPLAEGQTARKEFGEIKVVKNQ